MELDKLTPDTTFPYRLFRFAHKRQLNSVSSSYFAIVSKDSHPVGLVLSIDIDERWHHARSAATTFWQILVREFNHSESRSTLIRFEAALKELNKAVVKTQEKVRQPISVAAAILESNQIHFSTIGTSRILLVRSGKFSDVTSGPEKGGNQFAAVTSGDVDANDTLIIANQNIYEFLAAEPDELWQPREIDLLCQEIQSRAQNSEQALNCLIMRYDPDRPAQQTLYWEESEKHYPIKLPKFSLPTLPKIALPQLKLPTIPPSLKRLALPKLSLPTNFQQSAKVLLTRVKVIKPRTLLIAAVVIGLAIVGGVLKSRFSAAVSDEQAPVSLTDQFAGTSGNDTINFLNSLITDEKIDSLSAEQLTGITEIAAQKNIEIILKDTNVNELPEMVASLSPLDKLLFLVDQTGQLWQINASGQLIKIDQQFKIVNPQSIVAFSNKSLLISDQIGNIWHYSGKSNGPVALVLPSALSSGKKLIAKYEQNLYLYSQSQNAVYRQPNFTNSITTNSPYFGLAAISNPPLWAWTVNGEFYVITATQKLAGILRDQVVFKPKSLPNSTQSSRVSSIDSNLIVVANGHLLQAFDNSGKLVWQKFLLTKDLIGDLAVTTNDLWLSAGKAVYKIAL